MGKKESMTLVDSLDRLVDRYHLLKHPFYQAWTQGTLSKEALCLYAEQYYQHVKAFPEHLQQLADRSQGELETLVRENLAEELDPASPHPALWRQFGASLGVSEKTMDTAKPLPGIACLIDTFDELASYGTKAQAVGAFYAYESQVPEISTQKLFGLRNFYGVSDPKATAYFAVHEEADVRHRAAWRSYLSKQSSEDAGAILAAAERALKALWGALDAVYPEHACATVN